MKLQEMVAPGTRVKKAKKMFDTAKDTGLLDKLKPSGDFGRRCHDQAQLLQLAPQLVDPGDPAFVEGARICPSSCWTSAVSFSTTAK